MKSLVKKIQLLIDKGLGVTSNSLGGRPRKYPTFTDKIFGIRYESVRFYIRNKSKKVIIDGDDLIINDEPYKGTHGLWKLLKNPNKKIRQTYNIWWTNKGNFKEKDLNTYKEIFKKTYSIYENNDPSSKVPTSSISEKWKELLSQIWKEIKSPKTVSRLIK